jgi:hypothetical protein
MNNFLPFKCNIFNEYENFSKNCKRVKKPSPSSSSKEEQWKEVSNKFGFSGIKHLPPSSSMDGPSIASLKTLARNNGNMHQGSSTIVENHFEILSP